MFRAKSAAEAPSLGPVSLRLARTHCTAPRDTARSRLHRCVRHHLHRSRPTSTVFRLHSPANSLPTERLRSLPPPHKSQTSLPHFASCTLLPASSAFTSRLPKPKSSHADVSANTPMPTHRLVSLLLKATPHYTINCLPTTLDTAHRQTSHRNTPQSHTPMMQLLRPPAARCAVGNPLPHRRKHQVA